MQTKIFNLGRLYDVSSSLYTYIPYYISPSRAFSPLHLLIELTYRCNLRCEICQFFPLLMSGDLEAKKAEEISVEEILTFVRAFPRTSVVTLTGGEIFLRKDFCQIIECLSKRNKLHIITNGTLLTEKTVSFIFEHRLKKLLGGGLFAIGVSLQGPADVHDAIVGRKGAYEAACAGIQLLNELKQKAKTQFPHIHTTAVIIDKNARHLTEIYKASCELGVDYSNFTLFNRSDFSNRLAMDNAPNYDVSPTNKMLINSEILSEQFKLMRESAKESKTRIRFSPFGISYDEIIRYYKDETDISRFYCTSPWRTLFVTAYGDVGSCSFMPIGNIRKSIISKMWSSREQASFRMALRKKGIFPVCLGCCSSIYKGEQKHGRQRKLI